MQTRTHRESAVRSTRTAQRRRERLPPRSGIASSRLGGYDTAITASNARTRAVTAIPLRSSASPMEHQWSRTGAASGTWTQIGMPATRDRPCKSLHSLATICSEEPMVRRRSPVRVRERALKTPAQRGFLLPPWSSSSTSLKRRESFTHASPDLAGRGACGDAFNIGLRSSSRWGQVLGTDGCKRAAASGRQSGLAREPDRWSDGQHDARARALPHLTPFVRLELLFTRRWRQLELLADRG
jgi:hypothetical protein